MLIQSITLIEEKKYSIQNIKKVFTLSIWAIKEIYKIAPQDTIFLSFITAILSVLPVISAFFNAMLLNSIVETIAIKPEITTLLSAQSTVSKMIVLVVLMAIIIYIFNQLFLLVEHRFRNYHIIKHSNLLNLKVSTLDVSYFEDPEIANEIRRATENTFRIREVFISSLRTILSLTKVSIYLVILAGLSLPFTVFMFLISLPYPFFFIKWISKDWDFSVSMTERAKIRSAAGSYLIHDLSIRENRLLNAIPLFKNIQEKQTEFIRKGFLKTRRELFNEQMLSTIFIALQEGASIIFPLFVTITKSLTIGDFSFYSGRARQLTWDLDTALTNISSLYEASLGLDRVKNVMEMENKILSGEKRIPSAVPPKIEFKNVSFKYPKSKSFTLRNFSLEINPGEEIAIVGENGAGKTTFIKLLLRFYDPTSGEILLNGINIKEIDLNQYYKIIGALFQDYQIYNFLTIDQNVTIGSKGGNIKGIKEALKAAQAWDFVQKTDLKGKHKLSKRFENGIQLSTGEEQKLALARMFYRDAPILILDEPTASIDAVAEYKIFNRIYRFMKNKTVIIISHRFSTVRNAQKIYVFDKGRVIEQGSHKELLEKNGVYAKAFKLQAEGYTN